MDFTKDSFDIDAVPDIGKLMVSFGGLCKLPGMPIFEFKNILKSTNVNKVFVVDNSRSWYNLGTEMLMDELRYLIKRFGWEHTTFYGNSMGGYAAIKYGNMLEVERVVAIVPQVFVSERLITKYKDYRWAEFTGKFNKEFADIDLEIHHGDFNGKTEFELFYCLNDRLDKIHAELLANKKGVTLYPFLTGGHNLVQSLKECGILKDILLNDL
jgi:predicted esterase YcpF (UPF0227 family)